MAEATAQLDITEEDQLRATWYSLFSRLLAKPADADVLEILQGFEGDQSAFGQAIGALKAAAAKCPAKAIEQEYFDLFIGVGQGELVPYGSYYLTGFLHEKPLANLRKDMERLSIARSEGTSESEDHIAALFDMMAGLITGRFGAPAELAIQRQFFDDHIGCWAPRFFENLQAAPSAAFYMPVGTLGTHFLAVEQASLEMAT
ncbi:MAG: molecular chaperone TorD family protein [Pseudomonadota bacterium]